MTSAETREGSHFAPPQGGEQPSHEGSFDYVEDAGGAPHLSQQPDDTLQSIFGLPMDPPNGSQATPSAPFEPVASHRPASPSDTDIFLAIAEQIQSSAQSAPQQPSLTPASRPASFGTPTQQASAPANPSPYATQTPYPPYTGGTSPSSPASPDVTAIYAAASQRQPAAASQPANPLVAARNARSGSGVAGGSGDGLFPIQEVEASSGRLLDMSFGDVVPRRTAVIAIVVVVVLVLAAVGTFLGLRYKQAADARTAIDEAIDILRDTDDVIVPLDSAIAAEISTGVASEVLSNLMLESSTTVSNSLSSAEQLADSASDARDVLSDEEVEALDAVLASISARRSMLDVGRQLLLIDSAVSTALENLEQAYAFINEANTNVQAARDIYTVYSTTGEGDMWAAVEADNAAVTAIANAQSSVAAAKEAFSSADLTALESYLAARLNHVNLLLQFDTCIANGDADGANAVVDQCNQADAAQQEAALQVSATAAELLTSAYAAATADQREAYDAARDACVEADAILNDYLGITDTSKEMGITSGSTDSSSVLLTDTASLTDVAATDSADQAAETAEGVEGTEGVESAEEEVDSSAAAESEAV